VGLVIGPVVGGLDGEQSAAVFRRLIPKPTFLLPSLALVTIATGIPLATRLGRFPNAEPGPALFTAAALLPALVIAG